MWEWTRVCHESTPVPEELELAVVSALRMGQRRLRGRRALRRGVSGVLMGCAYFVLPVNVSPALARAVPDVPVLSDLARVVIVTEYHIDGRERLIDVCLPALELLGDIGLEQRTNLAIQTYTDQVLQEAEDWARTTRNAYVAAGDAEENSVPVTIDADYEIKYRNDHYLSFVLTETEIRVNVYAELYTYNINLQAGQGLTLRNMLEPGCKELANEVVRAGIAAQEAKGPDSIYLHEEEGMEDFTSIASDQRFYISEAGNPVSIFEKCEIAPGYMDQPELKVPIPK